MKVCIKSCPPTWWYRGLVGQVVEVEMEWLHGDTYYITRELMEEWAPGSVDANTVRGVLMVSDTKVVSENEAAINESSVSVLFEEKVKQLRHED